MAREPRSAKLTIVMTPALLERLNVYAEQHRWSRSTAAMALIESGLQREHGQPPEQAVVPGAH